PPRVGCCVRVSPDAAAPASTPGSLRPGEPRISPSSATRPRGSARSSRPDPPRPGPTYTARVAGGPGVGRRLFRLSVGALGILAFGCFALGPSLYGLFIGLDWSAYPGGLAIEAVFRGLGYHGQNAIAGVFWLLLGLLGALAAAFVAARRGVRGRTDPERRRVL